MGNGAADLLEAGKIPEVGEFTALARLDRLNDTIPIVEEDAFAVWLINKRESLAIPGEAGVLLDEVELAYAQVRCEPGNLAIAEANFTRPATAGGAAIAFVEDRH